MAENTKIEWAHHTFNPWIGCTKVGPGCDHCYAERDMDHRWGRVKWGAGQERQRTKPSYWGKAYQWDRQAEREGTRYRVFCASLADVFDNEVPTLWRAALFRMIRETPHLDWLLLTKRIGNVKDMLPSDWGDGWPNVWLGITVVNQEEANRDIPKLLATPAAVRWLSMEPLLGPVDLTRWLNKPYCPTHDFDGGFCIQDCGDWRRLDWIVTGGESGPNARPSHPAWFMSLRDQCAAAGVPFLFKQWGEWVLRDASIHGSVPNEPTVRIGEHGLNTSRLENVSDDMGWEVYMQRVGKKAAGRTLDGQIHDGFPEVRT